MIRTQVITTSEDVSFKIPENYIGKALEIIAFAKDEGLSAGTEIKNQPKFPVFHLDSDFKFNRDEANER